MERHLAAGQEEIATMREALPGWEDRLKAFCEDRQGILGIFAHHPDEWWSGRLGELCARCGTMAVNKGFDAYVPSCADCFEEIAIKETKFTLAGAPKNFDGVGKEPSSSTVDNTLKGVAKRVLYGLAIIGASAVASRVASGIRKQKKPKAPLKKNKAVKPKTKNTNANKRSDSHG
jgi:hypothetical protein